jgi:hypothetical protein
MNQAQNLFGSQYGVGVAEKVTVELHDVNPPYNIVYQKLNTDLFTNGMLLIPDLPCTYSGSYYIVIKKINTIETWSSSPISFNSSSQISFDFSNSASQAYGNNLKPIGNIFAIWSGDVTNDGIVDGSDISIVDNDSRNILTGYNIEDLNGDGVVDGSDLAIVDNNSKAVIHVIKP